jgi:hypothetical protein
MAPGFAENTDSPPTFEPQSPVMDDQVDDEARARQILKDLNAYVPEDESDYVPRTRDAGDDILIVVLVLAGSGVAGGLLGWFLAPPLIYDLFNDVLNVDTDGPESFRRLGAFMSALAAMLFGSMLVTFMRR